MLVKADRMTMATSLEGRVPLLDHPLVELVASVPSTLKMKRFQKKYLLRKVMEERLPHETLHGPKQGFNVPIPSWIVGPLREMVRDTLAPSRIRASGLFRPEAVQKLIDEHESLARDHSRDIWTLLMFQSWHDALSHADPTEVRPRLVG
jgi:asparagine synthase (glutamine-hydrolysing)